MVNLKCSCGGKFEEKAVEFEGSCVKALKCDKCSELTFTPNQFKKIIALRELAKEVNSTRKVVRIGNSLGITLPKAVGQLGLKVGASVALRLGDMKTLELIVAKR